MITAAKILKEKPAVQSFCIPIQDVLKKYTLLYHIVAIIAEFTEKIMQ